MGQGRQGSTGGPSKSSAFDGLGELAGKIHCCWCRHWEGESERENKKEREKEGKRDRRRERESEWEQENIKTERDSKGERVCVCVCEILRVKLAFVLKAGCSASCLLHLNFLIWSSLLSPFHWLSLSLGNKNGQVSRNMS
jgi:hypothetical protein